MILLAIETATDAVGAALLLRDEGDRAQGSGTGVGGAEGAGAEGAGAEGAGAEGAGAERTHFGGRAHAETLVPAIEEVCASEACTVRDLDAISVDIGPGLFTGLRVGVATAKALAQALGIGVLGVGSLDILAAAALEHCPAERPVASVVDARRGEVFAAVFHFERAGTPSEDPAAVREDRPQPMPPAALEEWLLDAAAGAAAGSPASPDSPDRRGRMIVVGDGAVRYREMLSAHRALDLGLATEISAPPPLAQARLAMRRIAAGVTPSDAAALTPDYRRAADARINWVQRIPQAGGEGA